MLDVQAELARAVRHFWRTRTDQSRRQGASTGLKDAGNRSAVTGGKHADGFVRLVAAIVRDAGLTSAEIHFEEKRRRTLPGYFRPTKEWDLVVVSGRNLVAAVEVKSQVGSFGNNFNNRVEEALGNATDFWAAYRKGLLTDSCPPWLGYLFMLEEQESSLRETRPITLDPYPVDGAFQGCSYRDRYVEVCRRLVRERLYDAACLFCSKAESGLKGRYSEPSVELGIQNFAISLHTRAAAFAAVGRKG